MLMGFVVAMLVVGGFVAVSPVTQAQVGIDPNLGSTFGLGTADLESTVIKIVQWALGFLGLIAVIFIMYGGFIWMTAAGNAEKVDKAKKIILRAVIGLLIVLLSWAIVTFIVDRALNLTGAGGGCSIGDTNGCFECQANPVTGDGEWNFVPALCPAGFNTIRTVWRDPEGVGAYVCQIVQAQFNLPLVAASLPGNVRVIDTVTTLEVPGTWQVAAADPRLIEFLPDSNFADTTQYRVELDAGLQFTTPPGVWVWGGENWTFTTSNVDLTTPPTVTNINPADGASNVCLNGLVQVEFSQKMRAASINDSTVLFNQLNPIPGPADLRSFSASNGVTLFSSRPTSPMDAGAQYSVELLSGETVDELDPLYRDPTNSVMDVCLNHIDGNASGTEDVRPDDNYMDPTNPARPWDFTADTDVTNTQCLPEIQSIDQDGLYRNGSPLINIHGTNFGIGGYVEFNAGVNVSIGGNNYCYNAQEYPANSCIAVGAWSDTDINTDVPGGPLQRPFLYPSAGAMDGAVAVTIDPGVCLGGDRDGMSCDPLPDPCPGGGTCRTSANTVSHNVSSPQIYNASALNNQAHGGIGQMVSLLKRSGADDGFGAIAGDVEYISKVNPANRMSATLASCTNSWKNNAVLLQMIDLSPIGVTPCDVSVTQWYNCPDTSRVGIQITTAGGEPSNVIEFIYTNEAPGPGLCEIKPQSCGVNGNARTFEGFSFGPNPGSAAFTLGINPPIPAAVGAWDGSSDPNTAQVTIPNLSNAQNYVATIANSSGVTSNGVYFDVPCGDIPEVVNSPSCSAQCVSALGIPNGTLCTQNSDCNVVAGETCQIQMASPNPYTGSNDVCINAAFGARFRVAGTNNPISMDAGTLNDVNIRLEECDNADCSGAVNLVPGYVVNTFAAPEDDRFTITTPGNLNADAYYRVTITQGVLSSAGAMMNAPYSWIIHTKPGAEVCPLESVSVSPGVTVLTLVNQVQAYAALANGPNCSLLNPAAYTWGWDRLPPDPGIVTLSGSTDPTETATVPAAPNPPNAGTTYIQATADGISGQGRLRVDPDSCIFNPDRCADPNLDGIQECTDSVCDFTIDRCTPAITDISPQTGPDGQYVTIKGCYFGSVPGTVLFGAQPGAPDCPNSWSNSQIVVTEQGNAIGSTVQVDVQPTNGFSTVTDSGQTGPAFEFTVANSCSGLCAGGININKQCDDNADCPGSVCGAGAAIPVGGTPGICPPLSPAAGIETTLIDITGSNFNPVGGPNPATSRVYYTHGLADAYTTIAGPMGRGTWLDDAITDTQVPVGATSGPVSVQVNNCPSNEIDFIVSCTRNSQCSTGCCDLATRSCQDTIFCTGGGVGGLCTIADGTNPNCAPPPIFPTPADYECISDTGDVSGVPNPPPEPPAFGGDCRFCCQPGTSNPAGLVCTEDEGQCSGTERGLYCGCDYDAANPTPGDQQCDPTNPGAQVGCGNDANNCCNPRPRIASVTPGGYWVAPAGPAMVPLSCLNAVFTYTFDTAGIGMDRSSMVLGDSIIVESTDGPTPIPGRLITRANGFTFVPSEELPHAGGVFVHIVLDPTKIKNRYGIAMWSDPVPANQRINLYWFVLPDATLCSIDHVSVRWDKNLDGVWDNPPSRFSCGTDGCEPSDSLVGTTGNQEEWYAVAQDADNTDLGGGIDFTWSEVDPRNVFTPTHDNAGNPPCPANAADELTCQLTSDVENGCGYWQVNADGSGVGLGAASTSARVCGYMCENPWPNPYAPDNDDSPYEDSFASPKPDTITGLVTKYTNFSTWYCRDDGLASLRSPGIPGAIVVKEGTAFVPGTDNLIKEYFFLRDNSDDAIGIRVMENERKLSARQWYFEQFGPAAPEPQGLTVDGYPAVRSGRTVYVAATNLQGGVIYSNVYLISYSEGADGDTIGIYNRLLENWEFNVNMAPEDKARLQRDMKRLSDLSEIAEKLITYRAQHDQYPTLEGGTYISTLSNSRWPSWQDTLGGQLGGTLPVDPTNTFGTCPAGADPNTCWNDTARTFSCPANSFIYQYLGSPTGEVASLFTRLEYVGVGSWQNYAGDPCAAAGIANATCGCFNYEYNVTGTATDRQGPTIHDVNGSAPNTPLALSGTVTMDVDVDDILTGNNGVDRVEFYVDDIRQATDSDGTNVPNWSWAFDTTRFSDGLHTFRVRAYDTVGNFTDAQYPTTINSAAGPDTSPPFIEFVNIADGDTITPTSTITVRYIDNRNLNLVNLRLLRGGVPDAELPNAGPPNPFTVNWDLTGVPGISLGEYVLEASGRDTAGNTTTITINVVLSEIDLIAPTAAITDPPANQTLTDTQPVRIMTNDNVGVVRAEVFVDGVYAGTGTDEGAGIYNYDLNTRAYANGAHTLVARAYDAANNSGDSAAIPVIFDNIENDIEPPTVSFISPPTPANGSSVDGTITIRVEANDNSAVGRVNFYLDYRWRSSATLANGSCSTSPATACTTDADCLPVGGGQCQLYYEWQLDTTTIADGWHRIQVDALDPAGNRSNSIEVRLNFRGPGGPVIDAGVVDPASGAPGTSFCIQADVTSPSGISRVEASIQHPDEIQVARVGMFLTGGSTYRGTWTSPVGGESSYFVDIEAESNDGYVSQLENIRAVTGACGLPPAGAAPVITSAATASGTVGTSFTTYNITATNTPTSFTAAPLPAGLSLTGNRIIGTPTAAGTTDVTLTATNAFGTGTQNLRITISDAAGFCNCVHIGGACSSRTTSAQCLAATGCSWNGTACIESPICSNFSGPDPDPCEARVSCSCGFVP